MAHVLTVRLPSDLHRELDRHCKRANVTPSQAARVLLRNALGIVKTPYDAGFPEGYAAGYAEIQKRLATKAKGR